METNKEGIIGEDNICPFTNELCDDECCPPGAQCNLWGSDEEGRGISDINFIDPEDAE